MRRSTARMALIALLAMAGFGVASPAFANGGTCFFQANGLALNFGTLDPASAANTTASTTAATLNADQVGSCKGVTMTIDADNGQHFSGSRRMTNGTDFIPYSLGLPISVAAPGNNVYVPFSFNGTVLGTSYQNVSAGSYSDVVTVTVTP